MDQSEAKQTTRGRSSGGVSVHGKTKKRGFVNQPRGGVAVQVTSFQGGVQLLHPFQTEFSENPSIQDLPVLNQHVPCLFLR